nr:CRE-GLB-4 protein [Haemonchus contortus]
MIKTLAFRLGTRHKGYMNEGNDNSYWAPFAQQLPIAIAKTYMDVVNHDNRIRRIFRVRVHADRSEEEELINSWRQLMNTIVEAMKRGYEGCPSQKTPMRLSITNSIISMASLRSGRSRSASQFLEPNLSPVMVCTNTPVHSSPALNYRSRSIFHGRARQRHDSQDLSSQRRLSSPNNAANRNSSNNDLLRIDDNRNTREQRRSLTITPFP